MADRRFDELREGLLRAGLAARHVRRAVKEIETHFQHLIEDERGRGATPEDGCKNAHELLGTNDCLVQSYAARPELRPLAHRWPAIFFVCFPLLAYMGICAATLLTTVALAERLAPTLHQINVAPNITNGVDFAAKIVLLGLLPLSVFAVFAVVAYRRGVSLRWPFAGIALLSVLASLANVSVRFTGGSNAGEIGAGLGFSPQSLPGQLARVIVLTSLAFFALWLASRLKPRSDPLT